MNEKKYLINIDFPTATARIHLNPNFFGGRWCRLDETKKAEDGGKIYATSEEIRDYLNFNKALAFKGKELKNIIICQNCSKRRKQSVYWDI